MVIDNKISFVHIADVHLSAPLLGFSDNQKWFNKIKSAQNSAFEKAINFAIKNNVDFVIMAGDTFDKSAIDYSDCSFFAHLCNKLEEANIQIYLCAGNHDSVASWENIKNFVELPKNVHFFNSEAPQTFTYYKNNMPMCNITGISFSEENAIKNRDTLTKPPQEIFVQVGAANGVNTSNNSTCDINAAFNIAVLHTELSASFYNNTLSGNVSIPQEAYLMEKLGYDYWALGHIHKNAVLRMPATTISYPGCIQGLHINAKGSSDPDTGGEYGFNYVELKKNSSNFENKCAANISFIPTTIILWKKLDVNVSSCKNMDDVVEECCSQLNKCLMDSSAKYLCARVILKGSSDLYSNFQNATNLETIAQKINNQQNFVYCQDVVNFTSPNIDVDALLERNLLPSKVVKAAQNLSADKDLTIDFIKQEASNAKFNVDFYKLDSMDIDQLIDKSLSKALSKLNINR